MDCRFSDRGQSIYIARECSNRKKRHGPIEPWPHVAILANDESRPRSIANFFVGQEEGELSGPYFNPNPPSSFTILRGAGRHFGFPGPCSAFI